MKTYPLSQLASSMGSLSSCNLPITGYAIDSRLVKAGDLFFALKGEKTDGHSHLREVAEKKALGAVVSHSYRGDSFGLELVYVEDGIQALQKLAKKRAEESRYRIFAITGSCGKTTTKDFTQTLLSKDFFCHATKKSYNSQLTLPLTILEATGEEDLLILEMGMSQPKEMKKLAEIAPPEVALFTTLALQHADAFFDGLDGILREKSEIFSSQTKVGILPYELRKKKLIDEKSCQFITFSLFEKRADFFLSRNHEKVEIFEKGRIIAECTLHFPHSLFYHNFLAAFALAREAGLSTEKILAQIPYLSLPPMRFEILQKRGVTFINDAYNANPSSTALALQELPPCSGKRIGVLSEMNALGTFAKKAHEEIGALTLLHLDYLICIGEKCEVIVQQWKAANKPCEFFQKKEEIQKRLDELVKKGDLVFLKGARSYALETLIFSEV